MSRTQLVQVVLPQSLLALKPCEGPGYKILDEVDSLLMTSCALITNNKHLLSFLEKFLAHHLLYHGSGKALYQLSLAVQKDNGERGMEWYEIYRDRFHPLSETNVAWTRMNRAMHRIILMRGQEVLASRVEKAPEEDIQLADLAYVEAANKFDVNVEELKLLCNWYFDRVNHIGDLSEMITEPSGKFVETEKGSGIELVQMRACWNIGNFADEWWDGVVIDEHTRYIELRQPIIEHASRKLATPSFKYLAEIYEDRSVILEELYEIAWPAILVTSHRDNPVESLKIAKSYINTRIHHLATRYTRDLKKQEWNEETETYESMEIPLFSDPDMDPSKHACLTYEEQEFELHDLMASLEKHLTPGEFGVVCALMRLENDKEFEKFAEDQPDRRLAAFEFYQVHESELREILLPFLGRTKWDVSCFAVK